MAEIQPLADDTKISSVAKYLVSLPYAFAPLAYLGYALYAGIQVDVLVWVLAITGVIVSMYVIFGKKKVDQALEQARSLTDEEKSEVTKNNE